MKIVNSDVAPRLEARIAGGIYVLVIVLGAFFPRWIGGFYMLAGACYLASCFDDFLALNLPIAPWVQLGSFVGESAMALWLLIVGVNDDRWRAAAAAQEPVPGRRA